MEENGNRQSALCLKGRAEKVEFVSYTDWEPYFEEPLHL